MPLRLSRLAAVLPALPFALILPGCGGGGADLTPVDAQATPEPVARPTAALATPPGDWRVLRVGDAGEGLTLFRTPGQTKQGNPADLFLAAPADAPGQPVVRLTYALPTGYAPPTTPGALELKRYASVRQAVKQADSRNAAFMPLLRHIVSRDIAMTSPVVMTGEMAGDNDADSSMAFLYAEPELGPTGEDARGVVVEDTEPMTVLAIGVNGDVGASRATELVAELEAALAQQPADAPGRWAQDGPTRVLAYNGPETRGGQRWSEVQLPVRWDAAENEDEATR